MAFPHLDPASHLHKKLKHAFLTWKKAESVSNSRIQNVSFAESEDALLPPDASVEPAAETSRKHQKRTGTRSS
ncbi:MAG: hypothetical protein ACQEWW_07150 [Bacillota bacterium]